MTKPSRYALFVRDSDRVYAVSLLSRAALELSAEAYETYRAIVDGTLVAEGEGGTADLEDFLCVLRENLFLLDDNFDELEYIRQRTREERFHSRQLGLVIAPTMGCNFSCHYCFEARTNTYLNSDAEERLASLVASRIGEYDSLAVQWFGGEPLRAMPIIASLSRRFLQICAETHAGYAATVITNGFLMTPDVSRELVDLGVREIQITLDGDKPLHDRTRRQRGEAGSFDRILANIRAAPDSIAVHVRVHLAPFNRESVLGLIDRLAREGMVAHIDLLYFAPLFNYRVGMVSGAYRPDGKRFATSKQFAEMEIEMLQRAQRWGFRLKDFLEVSYGMCTAVRANTLVVDPSGNLVKCYKDVGVDRENVGTLWTGPQAGPQLDKWLGVEVPRDEECRHCQFLPVCLGGCSKQWQEGADKSVICTPLRYNYEDRIRLYFHALDSEASPMGAAT